MTLAELEVVAVRPSPSVWTVEAQSLQDGTLYGVAIDPRMGAAILEVLSDPGETPPVLLGIEEWQVRWTLQPDAQDDYWSAHWGEGAPCNGCDRECDPCGDWLVIGN